MSRVNRRAGQIPQALAEGTTELGTSDMQSKKRRSKRGRKVTSHEEPRQTVSLTRETVSTRLTGRLDPLYSRCVSADERIKRLRLLPLRLSASNPVIMDRGEFISAYERLASRDIQLRTLEGQWGVEKRVAVLKVECMREEYSYSDSDLLIKMRILQNLYSEICEQAKTIYQSANGYFYQGSQLLEFKRFVEAIYQADERKLSSANKQAKALIGLENQKRMLRLVGNRGEMLNWLHGLFLKRYFMINFEAKKVDAIKELGASIARSQDKLEVFELNWFLYLNDVLSCFYSFMLNASIKLRNGANLEEDFTYYNVGVGSCGYLVSTLLYELLHLCEEKISQADLFSLLEPYKGALLLWMQLYPVSYDEELQKFGIVALVDSWSYRIVLVLFLEQYSRIEDLFREYAVFFQGKEQGKDLAFKLVARLDLAVNAFCKRSRTLYEEQAKITKLQDFLKGFIALVASDVNLKAFFWPASEEQANCLQNSYSLVEQRLTVIREEIKKKENEAVELGLELVDEEEKVKRENKYFSLLKISKREMVESEDHSLDSVIRLAPAEEVECVSKERSDFYPEVSAAIELYMKRHPIVDIEKVLMVGISQDNDYEKRVSCMYALIDILWKEINRKWFKCQCYVPYVEEMAAYLEDDKLPPHNRKENDVGNKFKEAVVKYAELKQFLCCSLMNLRDVLNQFANLLQSDEQNVSEIISDQLLAIDTQRKELKVTIADFSRYAERILDLHKKRGKLIWDKMQSKSRVPERVGPISEQAKKLKNAASILANNEDHKKIQQYSSEIANTTLDSGTCHTSIVREVVSVSSRQSALPTHPEMELVNPMREKKSRQEGETTTHVGDVMTGRTGDIHPEVGRLTLDTDVWLQLPEVVPQTQTTSASSQIPLQADSLEGGSTSALEPLPSFIWDNLHPDEQTRFVREDGQMLLARWNKPLVRGHPVEILAEKIGRPVQLKRNSDQGAMTGNAVYVHPDTGIQEREQAAIDKRTLKVNMPAIVAAGMDSTQLTDIVETIEEDTAAVEYAEELPSVVKGSKIEEIEKLLKQMLRLSPLDIELKEGEVEIPFDAKEESLLKKTLAGLLINCLNKTNKIYTEKSVIFVGGSFARKLQGGNKHYGDIDLYAISREAALLFAEKMILSVNDKREMMLGMGGNMLFILGAQAIGLPNMYSLAFFEPPPKTGIVLKVQVNILDSGDFAKSIQHVGDVEPKEYLTDVDAEDTIPCLSLVGQVTMLLDMVNRFCQEFLVDQGFLQPDFEVPRTIVFMDQENMTSRVFGIVMRAVMALNMLDKFEQILQGEDVVLLQPQEAERLLMSIKKEALKLETKIIDFSYYKAYISKVDEWLKRNTTESGNYNTNTIAFVRKLRDRVHSVAERRSVV